MIGLAHKTPDSGHWLQGRIFSGMRWTFWLAALSVPFSLGTRVLLARTGPEILGTFGLLGVYSSLASVFLYLGGDAVVMAFLPRLPDPEKRKFLTRYIGIVGLALAPWLLLATLEPEWLHFVFGPGSDTRLELALVWLAPVTIAYMLAIAALKGTLEIAFAQALSRAVPILSFLAYAGLWMWTPVWFRLHAQAAIWGTYLFLATVGAGIGLARLRRLLPPAGVDVRLPAGFWSYTLSLQSNSILNFFANRFDLLLVLRAGGLSVLGEYVALKSLSQTLRKSLQLLLDSLFPSLAHTWGVNDLASTDAVLFRYIRMFYPMALLSAAFVLCFAQPLLWMLGRPYLALIRILPWAVICASLQACNALHGLLLNASGHAQRALVAAALHAAIFIASFWPFWHRWGFGGAIAAWGLGELVYYLASYFLLRNLRQVSASAFGNPLLYFGLIGATALWTAHAGRISWQQGTLLWMGNGGAYLVLAGYRGAELQQLIRLLLPGTRQPKEGKRRHDSKNDLGADSDQKSAARIAGDPGRPASADARAGGGGGY